MMQPSLMTGALIALLLAPGAHPVLAATQQSAAHSPPAGSALTGRVTTSDGKPVAGADVIICYAFPKVGASTTCPGCYTDCKRAAKTNAGGEFQFPGVARTLVFDVMVARDGFVSKLVSRIDPSTPEKQIALVSQPTLPGEDHLFRGTVTDPAGRPVAGALVEPVSITSPNENLVGEVPGMDRFAITNRRGEFLLASDQASAVLGVVVSAPALAPEAFSTLHEGTNEKLPLSLGAAIVGKLMRNGKPVANAALGLVQVDKEVERFLGPATATTDIHGAFQFSNVAPNQKYWIYGLMGHDGGAGSLAIQQLSVGADGSIVDLKDLKLAESQTVHGRVLLSDGQPIPNGIQIAVYRNDAWDDIHIDIRPDGSFDLEDAPSESFNLTTGIPGYKIHDAKLNDGGVSAVTVTPETRKHEVVVTMDPEKHK
ncbi:hypothetical protein CCAX7_56560 [Capsulimonas corticalis]|uniref:Uncharacterized protein n=1 Tax=Capsulimonas corticalis TaxID=2219043 RepID=A0A402D0K0_9BACT|nr:hypothetical protein [Capsulimonas corticalis]BDI33605.1 hypothetical protein CCAX7_56560 [Capsulimonas corticalis]